MENHTDHPLTLTVEQAAKILGIGRSTAYELVHTGDIPSLRLGRRIVVPLCQVEAMLEGTAAAEVSAVTNPSAPSPTTPSAAPASTGKAPAVRAPTLF